MHEDACIDTLERDVVEVIRLSGLPVYLVSNHPDDLPEPHTSGAEALFPRGGVVAARSGDALVLNWRPRPRHRHVEGVAVCSEMTRLGREFIRHTVQLHAALHGWDVEPDQSDYPFRPVTVRWSPARTDAMDTVLA